MSDVDETSQQRVAHNEVLFRAINDQVLSLEERFGSRDAGFLCECADASCSETIFLSLDEYQRVHSDERRFFVVPGHEVTEIETVVERHANYLVVEKHVPIPEITLGLRA
jgi:hypothetical protein